MPSPLILAAHRILIATSIVFGAVYTGWEVLAYRRTEEVLHLVIAALSAAVTGALAYYLKNLKRFVS